MLIQNHWTLSKAWVIEGPGLHTGQTGRVSLLPCNEPGYWLWQDRDWVLISPLLVRETHLCTQVGSVMTLEHLLAALYGLGFSAVKIRVDGPECPILDGSAAPWVQALTPLRKALPCKRHIWRLEAPWAWSDGQVRIQAWPAEGLELRYQIDYPKPEMHLQQQRIFQWSPEAFAEQLAPARTFGFASDLAAMQRQNRALGGSLNNALLISGPQSLAKARFPDEPVRHKLLDLLGDLALLGRLLLARLEIRCGGHQSHVIMAKTLLQEGWLRDDCPPIPF